MTTAKTNSAENTLDDSKLEVKLKDEANSADRQLSSRASTSLANSADMMMKLRLQSNFSSRDEREMTSFLQGKTSLNKFEKKFLVKYILKGIPDHIRSKV